MQLSTYKVHTEIRHSLPSHTLSMLFRISMQLSAYQVYTKIGHSLSHTLSMLLRTSMCNCHYTSCTLRARWDEQFFFGKDQLTQKLWQSMCVHTQQRKVLKKLCYRIFVNVSFVVLQGLQKREGVCRIPHL